MDEHLVIQAGDTNSNIETAIETDALSAAAAQELLWILVESVYQLLPVAFDRRRA